MAHRRTTPPGKGASFQTRSLEVFFNSKRAGVGGSSSP